MTSLNRVPQDLATPLGASRMPIESITHSPCHSLRYSCDSSNIYFTQVLQGLIASGPMTVIRCRISCNTSLRLFRPKLTTFPPLVQSDNRLSRCSPLYSSALLVQRAMLVCFSVGKYHKRRVDRAAPYCGTEWHWKPQLEGHGYRVGPNSLTTPYSCECVNAALQLRSSRVRGLLPLRSLYQS